MTDRRLTGATRVDVTCAAAVVLGQAVSVGVILATALYWGWCFANGLPPDSNIVLLLLPFAGTVVTGRRLQRTLHGRPRRPWAHAWFFGFALASMFASLEWFKDPMHDIALTFGSHGRWGCGVVNEDGSPYFLLRDSTVPFILFAPVLVVTALHWLLSRRGFAPSA